MNLHLSKHWFEVFERHIACGPDDAYEMLVYDIQCINITILPLCATIMKNILSTEEIRSIRPVRPRTTTLL
jgi:hypothetical protein